MGVTRDDVAKLAGVSGTTVSYVMNNTKRISPEVCQRVWDAAKQLNYHPSLLARGLATNETRHIAIVVKNLQNPYYTAIQEGVQIVAAQEGYIVSVRSGVLQRLAYLAIVDKLCCFVGFYIVVNHSVNVFENRHANSLCGSLSRLALAPMPANPRRLHCRLWLYFRIWHICDARIAV